MKLRQNMQRYIHTETEAYKYITMGDLDDLAREFCNWLNRKIKFKYNNQVEYICFLGHSMGGVLGKVLKIDSI